MAGRIAYYGNIVKDGLVLDLDAAKRDSYPGSGTTWSDVSGFQNNGTLVNGPTFDANNGGSISFDGTNDNVNLGNILYSSTTSNTIDLWVNVQTFVQNRAILTKGAPGAGPDTTFACWVTADRIRNRYYNSANTASYVTTNLLSINIWYNLVWTYNNVNISLYENSVFKESASLAGPLKDCPHPILIAADIYGNNASMNAASLKIYNRALSAAEVTQNYNALKGRYGL
jgi:hypothetical protein